MKKEDVPQDLSSLGKITTEICYVTDESGNYTTQKSLGWDVKIGALDVTWQEVEKRMAATKERIARGEVSPLLYFMEKNVMDTAILAGYTGLWKWRIRRHLRPAVFKKLSDKVLKQYAEVFNCTVAEIKNMNANG